MSLPFGFFAWQPSRYFVVADYPAARDILQDSNSKKWYMAYAVFDEAFGGANFFSAEGERYKHTRRNHSTPLGPLHRNDMTTTICQKLDEWIRERLTGSDNDDDGTGVELDIAHELQLLTSAIIGKVAFDFELSEADRHLMVESLELAYTEAFVELQKNPFRKLLPFLYPKRRRALNATLDLHRICRNMLQHHKSRQDPSQTTLLASMVNDKAYANDQERVCDMVAYLAGGFETVAYTMAWIMLELARNQDIQTRLRNELRQCESSSLSSSSSLEQNKRQSHPFLKECIREAMRLHPVGAAGSLRVTSRDFVVDSYNIPRGSVVLIPYYAIQRDAKVFARPDDFLPDRWTSPTPEMDAAWMAFALGRRNCKGQFLANMEMQVVLSRLFSEYMWDVVDEGKSEYAITLKTIGTILRAKRVDACDKY